MYSVFGIEPESINNWKDLRYIVEKFGFNNGLLIARYPKRWMAMVMDSCKENGIKDVELSRIEEKLRQIKSDRFLKVGLPYTEKGWCESISSEGVIGSFDGVITREIIDPPSFYTIDDVPEEVFQNHREMQVQRNATKLAEVAKNLLISSNQLTLIDPYFQPKNKCIKVLKELIRNSIKNEKCISRITIYMAHSAYPVSLENLKKEYKEIIVNSDGFELEIKRVDDESIDFDFHARYLLTDKAGLRYDRGFVEPVELEQKEHKTDVVCLDKNSYEVLMSKYCNSDVDIKLVDKVNVTSND